MATSGSVADGRLREDQYYRLAVFRVHLPCLRGCGDDAMILTEHFNRSLAARTGNPVIMGGPDMMMMCPPSSRR